MRPIPLQDKLRSRPRPALLTPPRPPPPPAPILPPRPLQQRDAPRTPEPRPAGSARPRGGGGGGTGPRGSAPLGRCGSQLHRGSTSTLRPTGPNRTEPNRKERNGTEPRRCPSRRRSPSAPLTCAPAAPLRAAAVPAALALNSGGPDSAAPAPLRSSAGPGSPRARRGGVAVRSAPGAGPQPARRAWGGRPRLRSAESWGCSAVSGGEVRMGLVSLARSGPTRGCPA